MYNIAIWNLDHAPNNLTSLKERKTDRTFDEKGRKIVEWKKNANISFDCELSCVVLISTFVENVKKTESRNSNESFV